MMFLLTATVAWGQRMDDTGISWEKIEATRMADLNVARGGHLVFYAGGELTVVGGHTSGFVLTPTAEYYSGGEWHLLPTVYPHDDGMAVILEGGHKVLIAGSHEKNLGIGQTFEAEMYYPETHTFDGFSCLDRKRAFAQGVVMDSGQVLIVGNHTGNDAFEIFDGHKSFRHLKDVAVWHSSPYVLPISGGDVMVFGSRWHSVYMTLTPCDTVDRLKGKPFRAPLLGEWMPLLWEAGSHAEHSFIGDTVAGDYSYIIAAYNERGERAFIHIQDTVFTVLPTTASVFTETEHGTIGEWSPAVVDRKAHRVYMTGCDSTGRVYVFAAEYDKRPAPLTVYCTDPLPNFGNTPPALTPEGNLVVVGGIMNDNFSPLKSVWVLHTGEEQPSEQKSAVGYWLLAIGGLLVVVVCVLLGVKRVKRLKRLKEVKGVKEGEEVKVGEEGEKVKEVKEVEEVQEVQEGEDVKGDEGDSGDRELMSRIMQLLDTEQVYLKPDLQVANVADALGVHRNAVSACINSQQGCTFSQFVNDYRIRHAKQLLSESPDMKISAVGLASGFANERSFFRAFKIATGMTPGEWVREVGVES